MEISDVIKMTGEALGLFKSTTDVVKGIRELASSGKTDNKQLIDSALETIRDKLHDLQGKHLELQQAALSALEQNMLLMKQKRELEDKLAKLNKFEADRNLYECVTLELNTVAYREKSFSGPADKQPYLCPNCFDNSKKTHLSFHQHAMHTKHLKCSDCGTSVHVARDDGPVAQSIRVARRYSPFDEL